MAGELFKLFGTIAINNDAANKAIDETTNSAGELGEELGKTEKSANSLASKLSGGLKKALAIGAAGMAAMGAAAVSIGKKAIESYAEYEQLIGGVETLFKDSAGIVEGYANQAFRTAGLSANDYMETVTSFSASLLQSLDGDTAKAAEYSNRAIIDMSDNANKMGSSMESIQNAYQGFAKQNYTMLDNLKLGYGGTQEEMKRLISDASKMTDVQKELGITVDESSMSFGNVVNAISVMQASMGIAGTTAKEASETIQGSASAMKSAWQNLLTGIADDTQDFNLLVENFSNSLVTFLNNLIPRIETVIGGIGKLAAALIGDVLPTLLQSVIDVLPEFITTVANVIPQLVTALLGMLPQLITAGVQIITGILNGMGQAIPDVINAVIEIIPQIIQALINGIPALIDGAIRFLSAIINAIPIIVNNLAAALPQIINAVIDGLIVAIPALIEGAKTLLMAIVDAIPLILPPLINALPEIINTIVRYLVEYLPTLLNAAVDFLMAVVQAIPLIIPPLSQALPEIIETITETLISNLPLLIETAIKLFMTLVEAIPTVVKELIKALPTIINTILKSLIEPTKALFSGLWNGIKNIFAPAKDWFKEKVITPLINFFTNLWNGIKNAASNAWNGIKKIWEIVSGWFNEKIISPVKKFFSGMWNGLKNGAKDAWTGIKNVFSKVTDWFKNVFSKAWQAVKNVFSAGGKVFDGIKEGITNTFKTVVNAIIRGINKVISIPFNAINKVLDKIRNISFLGISPFKNLIGSISVPQIPTLAKGGVLKKGQIGLLEGDGAEAVVPLERNKEWISRVSEELNANQNNDVLSEKIDTLISMLAEFLPQLITNSNKQIVLNNGVLVGALASGMDSRLGEINRLRERGR